eukprot:Clim_evm75s142 gene=Clim_evmTU75s142
MEENLNLRRRFSDGPGPGPSTTTRGSSRGRTTSKSNAEATQPKSAESIGNMLSKAGPAAPIQLFANWEIDTASPASVPRTLIVRITNIMLDAAEAESGVVLAVGLLGGRRTLRSNELRFERAEKHKADVTFTINYTHMKDFNQNIFEVKLQRRKHYKKRKIFGFRTIVAYVLDVNRVLQSPMEHKEVTLVAREPGSGQKRMSRDMTDRKTQKSADKADLVISAMTVRQDKPIFKDQIAKSPTLTWQEPEETQDMSQTDDSLSDVGDAEIMPELKLDGGTRAPRERSVSVPAVRKGKGTSPGAAAAALRNPINTFLKSFKKEEEPESDSLHRDSMIEEDGLEEFDDLDEAPIPEHSIEGSYVSTSEDETTTTTERGETTSGSARFKPFFANQDGFYDPNLDSRHKQHPMQTPDVTVTRTPSTQARFGSSRSLTDITEQQGVSNALRCVKQVFVTQPKQPYFILFDTSDKFGGKTHKAFKTAHASGNSVVAPETHCIPVSSPEELKTLLDNCIYGLVGEIGTDVRSMRIMLVGGPMMLHLVVCLFTAVMQVVPQSAWSKLRFYPVIYGDEYESVSVQLGTIDLTYRSYFSPERLSSWFGEDTNLDSNEIVEGLMRYLTEAQEVLRWPIAEAVVTSTNSFKDVASARLLGNEGKMQCPIPFVGHLTVEGMRVKPSSKRDVATLDSIDMSVDYWAPKKKKGLAEAKADERSLRGTAEDRQQTRGNFLYFKVYRCFEDAKSMVAPTGTFCFTSTVKGSDIRSTVKNRINKMLNENFVKQGGGSTLSGYGSKMIISPTSKADVLAINIDGCTYRAIRFCQLGASWPTGVDKFPVATWIDP